MELLNKLKGEWFIGELREQPQPNHHSKFHSFLFFLMGRNDGIAWWRALRPQAYAEWIFFWMEEGRWRNEKEIHEAWSAAAKWEWNSICLLSLWWVMGGGTANGSAAKREQQNKLNGMSFHLFLLHLMNEWIMNESNWEKKWSPRSEVKQWVSCPQWNESKLSFFVHEFMNEGRRECRAMEWRKRTTNQAHQLWARQAKGPTTPNPFSAAWLWASAELELGWPCGVDFILN